VKRKDRVVEQVLLRGGADTNVSRKNIDRNCGGKNEKKKKASGGTARGKGEHRVDRQGEKGSISAMDKSGRGTRQGAKESNPNWGREKSWSDIFVKFERSRYGGLLHRRGGGSGESRVRSDKEAEGDLFPHKTKNRDFVPPVKGRV